jgi:hypothetical protein
MVDLKEVRKSDSFMGDIRIISDRDTLDGRYF